MTGRRLTATALDELIANLTERDTAVLKSVSDLRFVSGAQLTRLHFHTADAPTADARAARRALLRLTRLGCVARLPRVVGGVRSGSAGFVYRLDLAGQRLAELHGWQPKRPRRRSYVPGTLFLAHCLQVAELHTLLVEADRSGRLELLELSAEPNCWRSYLGGGAQESILKPDSYVRLGAGEFEDSYFVEIDRGTEGSQALLRQLKAYLAYEASGMEQHVRSVFPKTLWLTPNAERVAVVEACIGRLPHPVRGLFQVATFSELLSVITDTEAVTISHFGD